MELEETILHEDLRGYVDNRLKVRLGFYILLSIIILGFVVYHILIDDVTSIYTGLALIIGCVLGIIVSRMFKIQWDENVGKVISNLDVYGVIILLIYITFELLRYKIVEYFIQGPSVAAISLSLLGGIMIGRVLGIHRKILTEIKDNVE